MTVNKGPHEKPIQPKTRRKCPHCKQLLTYTGVSKTMRPFEGSIDADPEVTSGIPIYLCEPCGVRGTYSKMVDRSKKWRKDVNWAIHHLLFSWRPQ